MKKRVSTGGIKKYLEHAAEGFLLLCAFLSVFSVLIITVYIFASGLPIFGRVGFKDIILGQVWKPLEGQFGILPMIIASLLVTLGAVAAGVPIGLMTAVFLAEVAPERLAKAVRPAVELLAGIPSVVYGFFGLIVLVPLIDRFFGGGGNSLLAAIIILGIMLLPTIVSITETSLRAVPKDYKEGSLALGATHMQTIFRVIIPAARSGIMAGIVLGMGRAIGETMAVILVIGNTPLIPGSLIDRARTLTSNIALEMSYAQGLHQEALFATGVILFIFIMVLNILVTFLFRKAGE